MNYKKEKYWIENQNHLRCGVYTQLPAAPSRSKHRRQYRWLGNSYELFLRCTRNNNRQFIITIVDDLSGRCVTSNKKKTVCKLQLHFTYIGKIVLKVV